MERKPWKPLWIRHWERRQKLSKFVLLFINIAKAPSQEVGAFEEKFHVLKNLVWK
jgi:hypothetical protein